MRNSSKGKFSQNGTFLRRATLHFLHFAARRRTFAADRCIARLQNTSLLHAEGKSVDRHFLQPIYQKFLLRQIFSVDWKVFVGFRV